MIKSVNKSLDLSTEKFELKTYCPEDISKVLTKDGINRPYPIAELSAPQKIHVHLRAYVDFFGGFAEHGRHVLFGLAEDGKYKVKLTPIKSLIDIDPIAHQKCSFYTRTPNFDMDKSIFLTIAGPGWAQEKFQSKNRYNIMWTMIETEDCNPEMKEWFEGVDEIWAPTTCDAARFIRLMGKDWIDKTHVVHLGYDWRYNPDVQPIDIPALRGRYVFGVLGSWNKRKGVKQIIRAFCKQFKPSDPVSLLLVCKYGTRPYDGIKDGEEVKKTDTEKWDLIYEFNRYTADLPHPLPHVTLIDVPIHEEVLPSLIARFNCGVGFSMGESTWLPGLQLMAMKKPVIQLLAWTNGFTDYMNDGNSYLAVNAKRVLADDELVYGTSGYYKDQYLYEGNEDELAETMNKVYKNYNTEGQREIIWNAYHTVRDWTWENSLRAVKARLEKIHARL